MNGLVLRTGSSDGTFVRRCCVSLVSRMTTKCDDQGPCGQDTVTKFRELSSEIRSHFKTLADENLPESVLSDDYLKSRFGSPKLPNGFVVLRGVLDAKEQLHWARRSLDDFAFYPHNNLSVLQQNLPRDAHLKKVRWSCLGMNYDWTNRKYVEGWKSEFPDDLARLCVDMVQRAAIISPRDNDIAFVPEAAIVNFYTASQIMGPHRDDAELTMTQPIVSISLGCDAIFCIENKPFSPDSEVVPIFVKSGDVVIMSGESREALHGVAATIPKTFRVDSMLDSNDTRIAEVLSTMRININVRQVEDFNVASSTFAGRKGRHQGSDMTSIAQPSSLA